HLSGAGLNLHVAADRIGPIALGPWGLGVDLVGWSWHDFASPFLPRHGGPPMSSGSLTQHLPPSLIAWIPQLWSQVLFPGKTAVDASVRWLSVLVLLVVPGVLLYPCLSFHLFEPDEGRYAEIAREMLARGEWVVPYLQGEPYLDKPPLLYWLTMASFR